MMYSELAIITGFSIVIWTIRSRLDARRCCHDVIALLACLLYHFWTFDSRLLGYTALFLLQLLLWRWNSKLPLSFINNIWGANGPDDNTSCWTSPLLYPSRTAHTRLVPKVHSFSYSYLTVGVPVTCKNAIVNRMLAVDSIHSGQAWYQVRSEDHLYRISHGTDLQTQLAEYLELQGVEPGSYPFAYLVTAPRFLGYNFNPVSFWYLYNADKKLSAMILEVNNTFDERRMYLLQPENVQGEGNGSSSKLEQPERTVFSNAWAKDFHVSPFNDREGQYSLEAEDPLQHDWESTRHALRNTITLSTPKGDAKIVAEVFSTGKPLDPRSLSVFQRLRFVASWWWVGFVTFPRIVREAGKLFFLKSMQVWYRPEVNQGSIGRQSTMSEIIIERFFRSYIKDQINAFEDPTTSIRYTNPTPADAAFDTLREEIIRSTKVIRTDQSDDSNTIDLDVFSPFFFTHLVHYVHTKAAITACTTKSRIENRLLHLTQPEAFFGILLAQASSCNSSISNSTKSQYSSKTLKSLIKPPSYEEEYKWRYLRVLRSQIPRPPAQAYPTSPDSSTSNSVDSQEGTIQPPSLSELDQFVYNNYDAADQKIYQDAVIEILRGSLRGFNLSTFTELVVWLVRLFFLWLGAASLRRLYDGDFTGTGEIMRLGVQLNLVNLLALWRGLARYLVIWVALRKE